VHPDILVTVVNHNHNENALKLLTQFSRDFKTIVIDSGSEVKDNRFILLDNVYYSGLFNKACELLKETDKKWLLFIASDVRIDEDNYWKLTRRLCDHRSFSDIGLYTPSIEGRSHLFLKQQTGSYKYRDVNFVEGFMFLARRSILSKMHPVDVRLNKIGWGLDVMKGFFCRELGLRSVVDDLVSVYHPPEAGYSYEEAVENCKRWAKVQSPEFRKFLKINTGL